MVENDLELAIKAAIAAGTRILEVYQNEDFELEFKNDTSPLTKADTAANTVINSFLETTVIPIISEENKEMDYSTRKGWEKCWMVDPLDGTKEFIKRNGEFTVNIALIEQGRPTIGVIFAPVSRTLYYASVSHGKAYKVVLDENLNYSGNWFNDSLRLQLKKKQNKIIRVVGSRSHMNEETKIFMERLKSEHASVEIVPKGSSLKFCMMAEGKADIYPRFAPTMEWDTAAGQAICEAVGLKVINVHNDDRVLTYNKPNLLNDYFIVQRK